MVGTVSKESRDLAPNLFDLFARQAGRCQVLAPRIREEIRPIVARDDAVPIVQKQVVRGDGRGVPLG